MAFKGMHVQLSAAYHPQTNGQTEIVNRCLETSFWFMCTNVPQDWSKWLALGEWCYNTTYHNTIKSNPCEVVYCQQPPLHLPYFPGESIIELIDKSLQKREKALKLIKFHMKRVQNRMKQQVDKHISDITFEIGDMVYAKLHPFNKPLKLLRRMLS